MKQFIVVLRGLDPRIHVFVSTAPKAWMPTDRSPWAEGARVRPGQDENWGSDFSPLIAPRFPRTAPHRAGIVQGALQYIKSRHSPDRGRSVASPARRRRNIALL